MANYEYELNRLANAIEEQNFKLDWLCRLLTTKFSFEDGVITADECRAMYAKLTNTMHDHVMRKAGMTNVKQW